MPTFSLISQPQTLAPVNAPLWFVGSSTDNQFPFFKYNVNLFTYDRYNQSKSTPLGQFKIPPRPDNNYGVFDAHKILQSQVGSYNFTFSQVGLQPVTDNNSIVKYKCILGYEYNPNYQFINTFSYSFTGGGYVKYGESNPTRFDNASIPSFINQIYPNYSDTLFSYFSYIPLNGSSIYVKFNDGINIGYYEIIGLDYETLLSFSVKISPNLTSDLISSTNYDLTFYYIDNNVYVGLDFSSPNLLQQNDIITIQMDNQNQNGSYNGKSQVIYQLSTTQSITDIAYGSNPTTPPETGTVNLLLRNTTSASYSYAYPGTRQYTENNVDFGTTKEISYGKFATNYTGIKEIFLNQYETISIMSLDQNNFNNCYYQVKTYNQGFTLLNTYTSTDILGLFDLSVKFELGTGTKQIQGWTMSGTPIDLSTASYYSVGLINSSPVINAVFTYSIVPNSSRYENVRIMFQNRVGGYDYWNFNYDSKWTIDIKRTLYTKQLDYNYNIGDRGRTILNIDANVMYEASTDWISESDYDYLQELITSSDVYVIDEVNGYKLPINIEDTSYVQKTAFRDKLFNLKITYRYAYDLNLSGS